MIRAFWLHVFNVKYFQRIEICKIILNVIFRLAIFCYEMRHLGKIMRYRYNISTLKLGPSYMYLLEKFAIHIRCFIFLIYLHSKKCFHIWTPRKAKTLNYVETFSQWLPQVVFVRQLDYCEHKNTVILLILNDLLFFSNVNVSNK